MQIMQTKTDDDFGKNNSLFSAIYLAGEKKTSKDNDWGCNSRELDA